MFTASSGFTYFGLKADFWSVGPSLTFILGPEWVFEAALKAFGVNGAWLLFMLTLITAW